jgi:hypothetical protein
MTPIETDITEYLMWMKIHNCARTTIAILPQRGLSMGMGGT